MGLVVLLQGSRTSMLELHGHQLTALAFASIIDEIALECERVLPRHCRALGVPGVRIAIADGIAAARRLGIEGQDAWRAYVRLMFLFDREFEERLPWARQALADTEHAAGHVRINALVAAARAEIERRRAARKG